MIDYKSYDSVEDKLKAIKEAAAKKPAFNPYNAEIKILFTDRFIHYLEENINVVNVKNELYSWNNKTAPAYFNASIIDFGTSNDCISFIPHEKIIKKFMEDPNIEKTKENLSKWMNEKRLDEKFSTDNGVHVKAGRFIKIFGYNDSLSNHFYDDYTAFREQIDYEFELLKGDDIIKYYKKDNYTKEFGTNSTPLWKSCMAYDDMIEASLDDRAITCISERLKFYSLNDNCSILILKKKGSNLINCRCLLWTLPKGEIYMDRVYYSKQSELNLYKKYANDNGIKYTHTAGTRPSVMYIDYNKKIIDYFFREGNDYEGRKTLIKKIEIPYLDSWTHDPFSRKMVRK
jgi:hypothetical protein